MSEANMPASTANTCYSTNRNPVALLSTANRVEASKRLNASLCGIDPAISTSPHGSKTVGKKWSISEKKKFLILSRDGWACQYCGIPLTYELIPIPSLEGACTVPKGFARPTFDHIVPQSQGGRHAVENLVSCCRSCNSKKGVKNVTTWLEAQA